MKIKEFRIVNYKSFDDSGPITLGAGFNVIVGKNNSGKTALVEALSLRLPSSLPHRNSRQPRGQPRNPHSMIEFVVELTGREAHDFLLGVGEVHFPLSPTAKNNPQEAIKEFLEFLARPAFELRYRYSPTNGGISTHSYPSHGQFVPYSPQRFVQVRSNLQKGMFTAVGTGNGANDSFGEALAGHVVNQVYCFRAERLTIGKVGFADSADLNPNANNLAVVLNSLQGRNPARFAIFNDHVRTVFPTIHHVAVRPSGSELEIVVWNIDPASQREDLVVPLSQSGTGIGQVLAALYVIVTSDTPRTIIIDEPNTFLHPGALRALLEIMANAPLPHQYIMTTHAPDVIGMRQPTTVYMTRWDQEQTRVEGMASGVVADTRRSLLEVGARLSDLTGFDRVLWVEGPTEQECLPRVLRQFHGTSLSGTAIIAVRNTGDFERRSSKLAWGVYERLTSANALLPTTIAFCFDREGRTTTDMDDLVRQSGGLVTFLPRRCYENYLLHAAAITAVLGSSPAFASAPLSIDVVEQWLKREGGKPKYYSRRDWDGDLTDSRWRQEVKAADLLEDLFSEISGTREEYRKMVHSVKLTDWLIANALDQFDELGEFLGAILTPEAAAQ
jgi:hypothetical protein